MNPSKTILDIARDQGVVGRKRTRGADAFDQAVADTLKKAEFVKSYLTPDELRYVESTKQLTARLVHYTGFKFASYKSCSDSIGVSALVNLKTPADIAKRLIELCTDDLCTAFCLVLRCKMSTTRFAVLRGTTMRARVAAHKVGHGVFYLDGREFVVLKFASFVKCLNEEVRDV